MASFDDVHDTIAAEVAAGHIGRAVSVRGLIEVSPDHGLVLPYLARGLRRSIEWLDDEPERVLVSGSLESGHVCALLECRRGGTCVLACGVLRASEDGRGAMVDYVVLGNRGTARFEGDANRVTRVAPIEADAPELALRDALERSLRSRAPESIERAEESR